jgi:hypothetical protein
VLNCNTRKARFGYVLPGDGVEKKRWVALLGF